MLTFRATTQGLPTLIASPTTGQNSLRKKTTYKGALFFNALPVELKKSTEPVKVKNPLKTWLSAQPFYTVAEFFNLRDFNLNDY